MTEDPLDPEYLRACTRINPEDIHGEYVRISADLAYWNARYARAMRGHLMAKLDAEVLEANLDPLIRQGLVEAGAKTTEAMIEAAIVSDERLVEAKRQVIEAEVEKSECYGVLDSIRAKKEMLVSLGAHLRAEMEGDPLIREQARSRRVMEADS